MRKSILKDYIESHTDNEFQKLKSEISALYLEDNKNWSEISEILKVDVKLIRSICTHYNIKRSKESRYQRISEARRKTFQDKYGVDNIFSLDSVKDKIAETNLQKYGVNSLLKLKEIRDLGREKAIENARKSSREQIPENAKLIIYDKERFRLFLKSIDYSIRTFQEMYKRLNYYSTTVDHQYYKFNLDKEFPINKGCMSSSPESEIVEYIQSISSVNIIRNSRKVISPQEIDIYLPDYNLGIEFNGSYWHSDAVLNSITYHYDKSMKCKAKGIFIYHIWEYDWKNPSKAVIIKSQIRNLLGLSERIYARKCNIREVSSSDAMNFLEINHLQGARGSKIRLGLYYNQELVSLMTFGENKFIRKSSNDIELLRFCNKINVSVIGGASKLFKYFLDNYNYDNIISYCDISHGTGKLYSNLGFKLEYITNPNYIWIHTKNFDIKTRYQTQMKNEDEIMRSKGYSRIYNCGNYKFIFQR